MPDKTTVLLPVLVREISPIVPTPAGKLTVPDKVIDPLLLPMVELDEITTAPEMVEDPEALLITVPPSNRIAFDTVCPFRSNVPPVFTRMAFEDITADAFPSFKIPPLTVAPTDRTA